MTSLLLAMFLALVVGPAVFFFLGDRLMRHARDTWKAAGGRVKNE